MGLMKTRISLLQHLQTHLWVYIYDKENLDWITEELRDTSLNFNIDEVRENWWCIWINSVKD